MKQHLHTLFNLLAESDGMFRSYDRYRTQNGYYLVVPVSHLEVDEIEEMSLLGDYFAQKGDPYIATMVKNKRGEIVSKAEEQLFVLLKCPYDIRNRDYTRTIPEELAMFHHKGRRISFPLEKLVRIGQWKSMWEKRIDQMEQFWALKTKDHPMELFERLFIESFPYYVGLTENAIQYLVDTEMDDLPGETDYGTVCHHRFSTECWSNEALMRLPTDWVFDHPSRDIVEWVRSAFLEEPSRSERYYHFITSYENVQPLTSFSWRLIYSRLMFPVHYLECIEAYFRSQDEEQKLALTDCLQTILKRSHRYEGLLRDIYGLIGTRRRGVVVPRVNWL